MRAEKKYLVDEVGDYLDKSAYVFLANYEHLSVVETAELRDALSEHEAEFHVIKNSVMKAATREKGMPDIGKWLEDPTSIIMGGEDPAGVAKALGQFFKKKKKVVVKGGLLEDRLLDPGEISELAKLPPMDVIRAQLLGLLNIPAKQLVRVIQAVPQGVLNVLMARSEGESKE